jgi:hypothetical protein
MSKTLIYSCISYNEGYIDCLDIFSKSLEFYHKNIDFLLLCDKSFIEKCDNILKKYEINYKIFGIENPKVIDDAFKMKLKIFQANLNGYENLMFIDIDCVINGDILTFLNKKIKDDMIYVYYENEQRGHNIRYWSLPDFYTLKERYQMLKENKKPFNSGLFLIKNSLIMKYHFNNVLELMKNWKKDYFTEQSFINCYFNRLLKTDGNIFTKDNYKLFANNIEKQEQLILHYTGNVGDGNTKYNNMKKYWENFGGK